MPAVANIVLNDALATPVAHTFVPVGPDANGVWWFEEQNAALSPIGFYRLSAMLKRTPVPKNGDVDSSNRVNRVQFGIHTPKLETLGVNDAGITPPPTVAYVNRCNIEFILPDRDSLQERKDMNKFAYSLLQDSNVKQLVESLLNYY